MPPYLNLEVAFKLQFGRFTWLCRNLMRFRRWRRRRLIAIFGGRRGVRLLGSIGRVARRAVFIERILISAALEFIDKVRIFINDAIRFFR